MSEEILVNVTSMETRVALIENGLLQEIYIERANKRGIVGNIYKGRVSKVMPGMQAAFIDLGLERTAFIHVNDVIDKKHNGNKDNNKERSIVELLYEGQTLIVQVTKDPLGSKGARLTTYVSIPARYLVLMPESNNIGVSLRIEDMEERERLKQLTEKILDKNDLAQKRGFILRTAADSADEEALESDMHFLLRLWQSIEEQLKSCKAPCCVYEDLPLSLRTIRDLTSSSVEKIYIDDQDTHQKACQFVHEFVPHLDGKITLYTGKCPLFDLYSVEDEIDRALQRKVFLKSGGYLIIDQTEAMTTIDVNTGAFIGHRNLEETTFKTNMEATSAIARQLRLRNLGGIIILDFIDMEDEEHQRQVLRNLVKRLESDYAKTKISGVSALGLVEMARKRTRESLENILCEPCVTCHGRRTLKTPETVCYEIFREIIRESTMYDNDTYMVLASESVLDRLLEEESVHVAEVESLTKKTIKFQVEPNYSQEQFDIILV
ncbi:MAG: ribonuclease G [Endozoicomonadaceae bacterium]|nr:ribonuclease G [Endozoicomonadaceae bacterium]MCY4329265.1 ribonuclease G [Endozoicomonadaceae bacterium]